MNQILEGKDQCEIETNKGLCDGSKISCIIMDKSYKLPDGEIIGIIKNFIDITERKQTEEELFRERARLEMILRYESLLANIASQLNSTDFFQSDICNIFKMIEKEVIKKALSTLNNQVQSNKIGVYLQFDDSLPCIKGHPIQMEQVVINLLTNAIDVLKGYPKENKKNSIFAKVYNNNFILEICDNGPGISEEHLGQIFDLFFTGKNFSENMGLGLFINQNIIITGFRGKISIKGKKGIRIIV